MQCNALHISCCRARRPPAGDESALAGGPGERRLILATFPLGSAAPA
jgi:hypothetical protein